MRSTHEHLIKYKSVSKYFLLFFISLLSLITYSQEKRIRIIHADFLDVDEENYPGASIGLGNVFIEVDGATLKCKKAILYEKENYLQALGNVVLNQADTIIQTSKYIEYDGKTKQSLSWGNVVLKNQTMTLKTDTLQFDRVSQLLYYKYHGTIEDDTNILKSKTGYYYLKEHKFKAKSNVVITNPENVLKSNHLVYYTNSGKAFLYGKTTVKGKGSYIEADKGFYDTKTDISHFNKNAFIIYNDRRIDADSLYYDKKAGFASATKNVVITDTINKIVLKGRYGEFYQKKDSAFVVGKKALAITETEKDKFYIHGDTLLFTGKPEDRLIRAYHNVKFFKSDLSGKCDSLYSNKKIGILKLFNKPVLWTSNGQITGDFINIKRNPKTEKIDSLNVINNAFLIKKDSIDGGFDQIKGRNMLAKFENNSIKTVDFIGNGEVLVYMRDDENNRKLTAISITTCARFHAEFENKQLIKTRFYKKEEGKTYPPKDLPENVRKLKDFLWLENERPKVWRDIFKVALSESQEPRVKNQELKFEK